MKSQFEYTLKQPLHVAIDGQQIECDDLIVKCHRGKDKDNCIFLESYLYKCIEKVTRNIADGSSTDSKNSDPDSDESIEESIKMMIMMHSDPEDVIKMKNSLKLLMCPDEGGSQATIGGTRLTRPLFDDIGYEDLKDLIARYAVNFLSLGSMMSKK